MKYSIRMPKFDYLKCAVLQIVTKSPWKAPFYPYLPCTRRLRQSFFTITPSHFCNPRYVCYHCVLQFVAVHMNSMCLPSLTCSVSDLGWLTPPEAICSSIVQEIMLNLVWISNRDTLHPWNSWTQAILLPQHPEELGLVTYHHARLPTFFESMPFGIIHFIALIIIFFILFLVIVYNRDMQLFYFLSYQWTFDCF